MVITVFRPITGPRSVFHQLRRKEAALFCVRRWNNETPAAVSMPVASPDLFAPSVTHSMSLKDVGLAFRTLEPAKVAWRRSSLRSDLAAEFAPCAVS